MASSARAAAARGRGARPPPTGGATRRASPDAVGGVARRQVRRVGEGASALGWAEARRAREAGWADFGRGPEVRRRPAKEEKAFFICIFKEFLNAIFQILF